MSKKMFVSKLLILSASIFAISGSYGGIAWAEGAASGSKGVGPVQSLKLEELSEGMAKEGKAVYDTKCSACHKMNERYVGPELGGVTKRRTPEWIMNMILNPGEMLEKDETAKELLGEFLTPMSFQNVTEGDARKILEYLRYYEAKCEIKADAKVEGKAAKKGDEKASKGSKKK